VTRPVTAAGLTRRLFAAVRDEDAAKPFMAHVIRLMRSEPVKLQRAAG
ncbi:MAG: LysR family transcriptional regulator, partial [Alphaproteobacteria bacterium HGW-Alphaproteobacteria-2]